MKFRSVALTLDKMTDDEARIKFERWVKVTGRRIDWMTMKVDQGKAKTTVVTARSLA